MEKPSDDQVVAGRIARDAIRLGISLCSGEITGTQLDKRIEEFIRDNGCVPSLKGYRPSFSERTYQHTICLARNNEAVHGVPNDLVLTRDDLITIDLVVSYNGWHADTARTFTFSSASHKKLMVEKITGVHKDALSIISPNLPVKVYSEFCQRIIEDIYKLAVVKEFCGHGIGLEIHQAPAIPCSIDSESLYSMPTFQVGKSYAVEPVVAQRKYYQLNNGSDGWTVSADCLTAHMEDTIFISSLGVVNLTK